MERIKTYKAILLSVLGLVIVVSGSYVYMRHHKGKAIESVVKSHVSTLSGKVTRMHDGENDLVYSMDIPETASSSLSMDDGLVTITNEGSLYSAIYMTYEGSRGYSSADYITMVIAPKVHALVRTGTTTIGSTIWTTAETANSEWHVGQVGDGQWLMIVENKKVLHEQITGMLESLTTK